MPSTMAGGKSLSWHREVIIVALARIKFRDKRPKIWLVSGHFAFLHPLAPRQHRRQLSHLSYCSRMQSAKSLNRKRKEDNALEAASFFSILDLSLIGLDQSSPASAAAHLTFEGERGLVTVTSIAPSLPFTQRRMVTSPGRAIVPGRRCFSSLVGAKSALAAVSKITSLSRLCLAILSLVLMQPREWSPILSLGDEQAGQVPLVV